MVSFSLFHLTSFLFPHQVFCVICNPLLSVVQQCVMYDQQNKKRKENSSDLQSPHKGRLFYLGVLLSASEMSHTSENWHCDFQFVREAGWFHIPAETGCLPLSFMKYKSQIRAWRLRYCTAHAESSPSFLPKQDRQLVNTSVHGGSESLHAQEIHVHVSLHPVAVLTSTLLCVAERHCEALPAARPESPSWLRVCIWAPATSRTYDSARHDLARSHRSH